MSFEVKYREQGTLSPKSYVLNFCQVHTWCIQKSLKCVKQIITSFKTWINKTYEIALFKFKVIKYVTNFTIVSKYLCT